MTRMRVRALFSSQIQAHTHSHTHTCMHTHAHAHAHTHTHIYAYSLSRSSSTHAIFPSQTHTHTCTHTHTHPPTQSLTLTLAHTHTHTHSHTHAHTHTHTHTHTHIQKHTRSRSHTTRTHITHTNECILSLSPLSLSLTRTHSRTHCLAPPSPPLSLLLAFLLIFLFAHACTRERARSFSRFFLLLACSYTLHARTHLSPHLPLPTDRRLTQGLPTRSLSVRPYVSKKEEPPAEYTYGEFPLPFFGELLDKAAASSAACPGGDRSAAEFLDLGSGAGRLVLAAAAATPPWKRVTGVEFLSSLHTLAEEKLAQAQALPGGLLTSEVVLENCSWDSESLDLSSIDVAFAYTTHCPLREVSICMYHM